MIPAGRRFVRIDGQYALVKGDPELQPIVGCANAGFTIKPCNITLKGQGYSAFVRIGGQPVCLDTLSGLTDGTPPGIVRYTVVDARQHFVEATA